MHYTYLHNEEVWRGNQRSHQGRWDFAQSGQKHCLVMRKINNKVTVRRVSPGWVVGKMREKVDSEPLLAHAYCCKAPIPSSFLLSIHEAIDIKKYDEIKDAQ